MSNTPEVPDALLALHEQSAEDMSAPLDEELEPWVERHAEWGQMLRHPLVYQIPMYSPGNANRVLAMKREQLVEAQDEQDWTRVVLLHERPHRLNAFIDYCTGRDEFSGEVLPLVGLPEFWDLAEYVWTDSENIEQHIDDWRALFSDPENLLWLGDREAFDALGWDEDGTIEAYRGGTVGDWSWTTDVEVAEFFSRRSGHPVRTSRIHRDECFGYLTSRSESELLVRLTEERTPLVYPDGHVETGGSW